MESDLRAIVNGLIGPTKAHWGISPREATFPRVNLHLIDEQGQNTFAGRITIMRECLVQIDVWAKTQAEAVALSQKLIPLDGHNGFGKVNAVLMKNKQADIDTTTNEPIYRVMFEYRVFYSD